MRRTRSTRNAFAASGWLLAEVALILMVIFQGSQSPTAPEVPTGDSSVAHPPPKPPSTDPTPPEDDVTCRPAGLRRQPEEKASVVLGRGHDARAARTLVSRIAAGPGHRPGLILLFGVSYSSSSPNGGQAVSEDLARLISSSTFGRRYRPVIRPFLQVYGPQYRTGEVFADVYYFGRATCVRN